MAEALLVSFNPVVTIIISVYVIGNCISLLLKGASPAYPKHAIIPLLICVYFPTTT